MNEQIFMIVALITGGVLGMLFFGGLWFTVRKAMTSKTPALLFLGSFMLRVGIVLAVFIWLYKGAIG
jgi:F1F0 ATPase subunit 2